MWDFQIKICIFGIFVLSLHSFSWFPFWNTPRELGQQMEKRSTLYFEKERTRAALHRSKGYLNLSHPSYNMIRSLLTSKTLQLCKPKNLKKSYILSAVPCTIDYAFTIGRNFLKVHHNWGMYSAHTDIQDLYFKGFCQSQFVYWFWGSLQKRIAYFKTVELSHLNVSTSFCSYGSIIDMMKMKTHPQKFRHPK